MYRHQSSRAGRPDAPCATSCLAFQPAHARAFGIDDRSMRTPAGGGVDHDQVEPASRTWLIPVNRAAPKRVHDEPVRGLGERGYLQLGLGLGGGAMLWQPSPPWPSWDIAVNQLSHRLGIKDSPW
jgi:hypothetical protein